MKHEKLSQNNTLENRGRERRRERERDGWGGGGKDERGTEKQASRNFFSSKESFLCVPGALPRNKESRAERGPPFEPRRDAQVPLKLPHVDVKSLCNCDLIKQLVVLISKGEGRAMAIRCHNRSEREAEREEGEAGWQRDGERRSSGGGEEGVGRRDEL